MIDGPRACKESEFEDAVALTNSIFRARSDQDIRTDYPLVFDPSKREYMRVVCVDNRVVAHVPLAPREVIANGDRLTVGIISPTSTHPEYRHRGYGTLCLQDCIEIMEQSEWPISVLWTIEPTFPFYQQVGWEAVGTQGHVYRLLPAERELFVPGDYEVIGYSPSDSEHLDAIIELHEAEPYRVARSRMEYEALFTLHKTRTLLALRDGAVAAYLIVGAGVNKSGWIEGGGEEAGLETLAHQVLREEESECVQVVLPLTSTALGSLMSSKKPGLACPVEEAAGVGYQMMRVNSLDALLRRMTVHLSERSVGLWAEVCLVCEDNDEAVTLTLKDGSVELVSERKSPAVVLNRRQLTQLIFGSHAGLVTPDCGSAAAVLRQIFPFYFPMWELDHS